MRMHMPALAILALIVFWGPANALADCPELTRLRREAAEAVRQMAGVPTSERCQAFGRFSAAWREIVQYAKDHRDLCQISGALLDAYEKRQREAVSARDNVCAGRVLQPFPPDIIKR